MCKQLGIVGKKLTHSFSPQYFAEKFKQKNLENGYSYELFPLKSLDNFPAFLLNHPNLEGFNVTIPYKEAIIDFLQELTLEAKAVGAVNTVKFYLENGEKKWKGYNTDVIGFENSLNPFLKQQLHKKALILGTGGAAKAVAFVLKKRKIDFLFVSRKPNHEQIIGYESLTKEIVLSHTLIVNTTPVGMFPNVDDCVPLPFQYLGKHHLCFDLVYNPPETLFLKKAKEQGAQIKNGLEMLHLQADAAWEIWKSDKK